jgi:hypothetical protein
MIRRPAQLEVVAIYEALRYWRDAPPGTLSPRQRLFCETWERIENPSAAAVGRELGITRQAAAKMGRLIVARLASAAAEVSAGIKEAKEDDAALEDIARLKTERICRRPEYLERSERRGAARWLHFKAAPGFDERLGRATVSGYAMREVSESEAAAIQARGVPLVRRRWRAHKESPLARWWIEKARELARARGIGYAEALQALYRENQSRRPAGAKGSGRCRRCGCPLPYGETIPESGMGRVTAAREFCSDFCKTTHKRALR